MTPVQPGDHRTDDVAAGLARRLRLPGEEGLHRSKAMGGLFAFVNGAISIGLMAAVAADANEAFVFPSLGPTAFLLFYTPTAASASPRNAISGHLIGLAMGALTLAIFGLLHAGPTINEGVSIPHIGTAAPSLGATCGLMIWLGVPQPPAGATTMIVSLGMIASLTGLVTILLGSSSSSDRRWLSTGWPASLSVVAGRNQHLRRAGKYGDGNPPLRPCVEEIAKARPNTDLVSAVRVACSPVRSDTAFAIW